MAARRIVPPTMGIREPSVNVNMASWICYGDEKWSQVGRKSKRLVRPICLFLLYKINLPCKSAPFSKHKV